jgi:TolB-like protein
LEIQKACCKEKTFQIRVGIHIGDIIFSDNDVFGDGVNIAARIEAAGEPGGIYFSEKVFDDIRNKKNLKATFFTEKALKNIAQPVKIYSLSNKTDKHIPSFTIESNLSEKLKSIIVLPFVNMSPEPDQEYFSDGLTEEIITDLSHIPELLVISRNSSMTFKGSDLNTKEIAHKVNAHYVLEGSVRKAGNNLRITAQLIDALKDIHLWAEKYTGKLDDVFSIQEDVSKRIVTAIKGKFSSEDKEKLSSRLSAPNVGIYEAYSRARYEFWSYEPNSLDRAIKILEKAQDIFGEHPLLWSGIGAIHWQLYHYQGDITEVHLYVLQKCVQKLFNDDPNSAPGHRLSSYLAINSGETGKAIQHLRIALNEDPNDSETLLWLSYFLAIHAGLSKEARLVAERWLAVDPLHPISEMCIHLADWMSGDLDKAKSGMINWYKKDPQNHIVAFYLGHFYAWTGHKKKCLELAEWMFERDPDEAMGQALRFVAYSLSGKKYQAEKAITVKTKEWIWRDFHLPWLVAEGYSLLGEIDKAIKWLERAIDKGIINYPMLSEGDPLMENIRSEARFTELMQRVKQEWENIKL